MFALEMIHYIFYFTYLETVTAFNFKLSGGYIREKVTLIFMKPAISTPTVKEKKTWSIIRSFDIIKVP